MMNWFRALGASLLVLFCLAPAGCSTKTAVVQTETENLSKIRGGPRFSTMALTSSCGHSHSLHFRREG
jgi:hypothetical protein